MSQSQAFHTVMTYTADYMHALTYTLNTLTFTAVLPVYSALTCPVNYKLSMAIKSKLPHASQLAQDAL